MENNRRSKPLTTIAIFLLITVITGLITLLIPMAEIWMVNFFIGATLEYDAQSILSFAFINGVLFLMYFLLTTSKIPNNDQQPKQ